jgi:CrcB protein
VTLLAIAIAGALGCVARYLAAVGVQRLAGGTFPVGTLAVNVSGCFAIGIAMAVFAARGELDSRLRMTITIGFLGGFTTYSAFAYETIDLIEQGRTAAAALYVGLTTVVATAAAAAGLAIGRAWSE